MDHQPDRQPKSLFSLKNNPKLRTALSVLTIIAAIVTIVIIIATGWGRAASDADKLQSPTEGVLVPNTDGSDPTYTTESPIPTIPEEPTPTLPPIEAGDNVTVTPVETPDKITIDKSTSVTPDHPEYIEATIGDGPYISPEGQVYKNDRTISIDVFDTDLAQVVTYTFGYATGTCNRFLYLNPVISLDDGVKPYAMYRFDPTAGTILTAPREYESQTDMDKNCRNYTVRRAMDLRSPAGYADPLHPGTVWYADNPIDQPTYIDVIVYEGVGIIKHLLRIWIDKDENGCYFLANIENRDLLQNGQTQFSSDEIYRIYEMASADMYDAEKLRMVISSPRELEVDDFTFDYRAKKEGCYYPYLVPAKPGGYKKAGYYANMDIMAVTLRNHTVGYISVTLYYHILLMPDGDNPGIYEYIGRDYPYNSHIDILHSHGYPGYD